MLSPDNHLEIFAALMGLAALAFWLQTTRLGKLLTGTVLVILMAIVAANVGLIPHQAPTYDFVFTYLPTSDSSLIKRPPMAAALPIWCPC